MYVSSPAQDLLVSPMSTKVNGVPNVQEVGLNGVFGVPPTAYTPGNWLAEVPVNATTTSPRALAVIDGWVNESVASPMLPFWTRVGVPELASSTNQRAPARPSTLFPCTP